ncbi:MAG: D-amino acid dehydrogenase [Candidatus Competibacteraceae bacterium]|nr:D-amino acid dehydrogenase [Candidatus Competibacteraceae bacterium]
MHVGILGAGVIGITTAYSLLRRDIRVTVIDRASGVARGASFGNGGQLSYSYVNPLASPDLLKTLPRMIAGRDPAFRVQPIPSVKLAQWGLQFLMNCRSAITARNTTRLTRLALFSRAALHRIIEEHRFDFHFRKNGKIVLLSSAAEMSHARKACWMKNALGCSMRVLDRAALIDLEPSLTDGPNDFVGGIHAETDEAGDSCAFTQRLVDLCYQSPDFQLQLGTDIKRIRHENRRITAIETDQGDFTADAYVLALGAESPLMAKTLRLNLPVYPLKGYSVTVPLGKSAPVASVTDSRNRTVFCALGHHLRIAGIAELVGYNDHVDRNRIDQLIGLAQKRFPRGGDYTTVISRWQGWRPLTPSSLPLIGPAPKYDNLFVNTGHGLFGWTLACGSAELIAEWINPRYRCSMEF